MPPFEPFKFDMEDFFSAEWKIEPISTPKKEFEVGDRVICIERYDGNSKIVGKTGTVIGHRDSYREKQVAIEFDVFVDGHGCRGKCEYGYGYNVESYAIRKISK